MTKKTERIEVSNKSIPCTPDEALKIFEQHSNAGIDVAWFTMIPVLSMVKARMGGMLID